MSTSVKQLEANLLGISGAPVTFSSAIDYVLTNPCPAYVSATFTASGKKLYLPKMDSTDALREGQCVVITNYGAYPFDVYLHDLSSFYTDVEPMASLVVWLSASGDGGSFSYLPSQNGERIVPVLISAPYEPDPTVDFGKTLIFTAGTTINLLARSAYPQNYYFNVLNGGAYISSVLANGGDTINGSSSLSLNNYGSAACVINADSQWLTKSYDSGGFSPSSGILSAASGGTGVGSPTAHTLPVAEGASPFTFLGPLTNGQMLIGSTGANPSVATIGVDSFLGATTGAGSFSLSNKSLVSPYIVGANAPYSTISSGIAAAVAGGASNTSIKIVYVQPGDYTENITLVDGIMIVGLGPTNPLIGIFNPLGSGAGFNPDTQNCATKLIGTVTINTTAITRDTSAGMQNFWISPPTGDAVTALGDITGTYQSLLSFFGCKIEVTQSTKSVFNNTAYFISANGCILFDNTSDLTGNLMQCSTDGSAAFLMCDTCGVYTNASTTANVFATGSNPVLRFDNCNISTCFDASNATSYFFRAWFSTHYNDDNPTNPYHVTGASTTGRIVYEKCNIQQLSGINIATIGNSAFEYQEDNCGIGTLGFGASSAVVTGGAQTRQNLQRTATSTYGTQLDLIRSGYAGASLFNFQAGVHTTDATVTTLASVGLNQLESITLKGTITAAQSDHTNALGGDFLITARRASGGNVTLVGSAVTNVNSSSAATFTCDVDTGTQTVRIRVTGVSATVYNWVTNYTYQKVLTNS